MSTTKQDIEEIKKAAERLTLKRLEEAKQAKDEGATQAPAETGKR